MNLLHLFVPHHKNNFRAKILHHTSLLFLIIFITVLSTIGIVVKKSYPEVLGISYKISDQELLNLVNYERTQKGLKELKLNAKLTNAAMLKADHMFKNNYWAHFAPDGTTPWNFIKDQSYEYIYAGENLAKGYQSSYDTVKAWMNSPTHRDNILSEKYEDIGFAIKEGRLEGEDTILIVQMFGSTAIPNLNNPPETIENKLSAGKSAIFENQALGSSKELSNDLEVKPLINIIFGTKAIIFSLLSVLLTALIIDLVIVEKNKIPRIVGNNLDHIILLTLFMVFMFVSSVGSII